MFRPSTELLELREGLTRWGESLSAGHVEQDAAASFSWDKWKLVRRTGILGLPFEERWGGLGQDLRATMYLLEALGEHCRDGGLCFSVTTTMASTGVPLAAFGSLEQKATVLPRICSGEAVGAHAITEPGGGSDALHMLTRAERDGTDFVLDGTKCFVSNGPIADVFMIYARTRPEGGPLGVTAFLVERDTPGLSLGPAESKMGLRTSPLCTVHLDAVRVPATAVVGRVGGGFMVLDHVMKREILFSFVVNVGEMAHRLDRCVRHAKEREAFGQPIGGFQSIARRIVDMRIQTETARKWLYDTAERLEAGQSVTEDLAIAKLLASEANVASGLSAVQIFGGYGYMSEYGLEKDLRNAVAGTIYSGTTEIQYNRIASMLGL